MNTTKEEEQENGQQNEEQDEEKSNQEEKKSKFRFSKKGKKEKNKSENKDMPRRRLYLGIIMMFVLALLVMVAATFATSSAGAETNPNNPNPPPSQLPPVASQIVSYSSFEQGMTLMSTNLKFSLDFQQDLTLRRNGTSEVDDPTTGPEILWAAGANFLQSLGTGAKLSLNNFGLLQIVDENGVLRWQSYPKGKEANSLDQEQYILQVLDQGTLQIILSTKPLSPLWTNATVSCLSTQFCSGLPAQPAGFQLVSSSSTFFLVFRDDNNLVTGAINGTTGPIFDAATNQSGSSFTPYKFQFLKTGNLLVTDFNQNTLWSSGSAQPTLVNVPLTLVVSDSDGQIYIYSGITCCWPCNACGASNEAEPQSESEHNSSVTVSYLAKQINTSRNKCLSCGVDPKATNNQSSSSRPEIVVFPSLTKKEDTFFYQQQENRDKESTRLWEKLKKKKMVRYKERTASGAIVPTHLVSTLPSKNKNKGIGLKLKKKPSQKQSSLEKEKEKGNGNGNGNGKEEKEKENQTKKPNPTNTVDTLFSTKKHWRNTIAKLTLNSSLDLINHVDCEEDFSKSNASSFSSNIQKEEEDKAKSKTIKKKNYQTNKEAQTLVWSSNPTFLSTFEMLSYSSTSFPNLKWNLDIPPTSDASRAWSIFSPNGTFAATFVTAKNQNLWAPSQLGCLILYRISNKSIIWTSFTNSSTYPSVSQGFKMTFSGETGDLSIWSNQNTLIWTIPNTVATSRLPLTLVVDETGYLNAVDVVSPSPPVWSRPIAVPSLPSSWIAPDPSSLQKSVIRIEGNSVVILLSANQTYELVFEKNTFALSIVFTQNPSLYLWQFRPDLTRFVAPLELQFWSSGLLVLIDATKAVVWETGTGIFQDSIPSSVTLSASVLTLSNSPQLTLANGSKTLWQSQVGVNDTQGYRNRSNVLASSGKLSLSSPSQFFVNLKQDQVLLQSYPNGTYQLLFSKEGLLVVKNSQTEAVFWISVIPDFVPTETTNFQLLTSGTIWIERVLGSETPSFVLPAIEPTSNTTSSSFSDSDSTLASTSTSATPSLTQLPLSLSLSEKTLAEGGGALLAYQTDQYSLFWKRPLAPPLCNGKTCPFILTTKSNVRSSPQIWSPGNVLLLSSDSQVALKFLSASDPLNEGMGVSLRLYFVQNPNAVLWEYRPSPARTDDTTVQVEFWPFGLFLMTEFNNNANAFSTCLWNTQTAVFQSGPVFGFSLEIVFVGPSLEDYRLRLKETDVGLGLLWSTSPLDSPARKPLSLTTPFLTSTLDQQLIQSPLTNNFALKWDTDGVLQLVNVSNGQIVYSSDIPLSLFSASAPRRDSLQQKATKSRKEGIEFETLKSTNSKKEEKRIERKVGSEEGKNKKKNILFVPRATTGTLDFNGTTGNFSIYPSSTPNANFTFNILNSQVPAPNSFFPLTLVLVEKNSTAFMQVWGVDRNKTASTVSPFLIWQRPFDVGVYPQSFQSTQSLVVPASYFPAQNRFPLLMSLSQEFILFLEVLSNQSTGVTLLSASTKIETKNIFVRKATDTIPVNAFPAYSISYDSFVFRLTAQGNVVLQNLGNAIWTSQTCYSEVTKTLGYQVKLQNDGSLNLLDLDNNEKLLWSTSASFLNPVLSWSSPFQCFFAQAPQNVNLDLLSSSLPGAVFALSIKGEFLISTNFGETIVWQAFEGDQIYYTDRTQCGDSSTPIAVTGGSGSKKQNSKGNFEEKKQKSIVSKTKSDIKEPIVTKEGGERKKQTTAQSKPDSNLNLSSDLFVSWKKKQKKESKPNENLKTRAGSPWEILLNVSGQFVLTSNSNVVAETGSFSSTVLPVTLVLNSSGKLILLANDASSLYFLPVFNCPPFQLGPITSHGYPFVAKKGFLMIPETSSSCFFTLTQNGILQFGLGLVTNPSSICWTATYTGSLPSNLFKLQFLFTRSSNIQLVDTTDETQPKCVWTSQSAVYYLKGTSVQGVLSISDPPLLSNSDFWKINCTSFNGGQGNLGLPLSLSSPIGPIPLLSSTSPCVLQSWNSSATPESLSLRVSPLADGSIELYSTISNVAYWNSNADFPAPQLIPNKSSYDLTKLQLTLTVDGYLVLESTTLKNQPQKQIRSFPSKEYRLTEVRKEKKQKKWREDTKKEKKKQYSLEKTSAAGAAAALTLWRSEGIFGNSSTNLPTTLVINNSIEEIPRSVSVFTLYNTFGVWYFSRPILYTSFGPKLTFTSGNCPFNFPLGGVLSNAFQTSTTMTGFTAYTNGTFSFLSIPTSQKQTPAVLWASNITDATLNPPAQPYIENWSAVTRPFSFQATLSGNLIVIDSSSPPITIWSSGTSVFPSFPYIFVPTETTNLSSQKKKVEKSTIKTKEKEPKERKVKSKAPRSSLMLSEKLSSSSSSFAITATSCNTYGLPAKVGVQIELIIPSFQQTQIDLTVGTTTELSIQLKMFFPTFSTQIINVTNSAKQFLTLSVSSPASFFPPLPNAPIFSKTNLLEQFQLIRGPDAAVWLEGTFWYWNYITNVWGVYQPILWKSNEEYLNPPLQSLTDAQIVLTREGAVYLQDPSTKVVIWNFPLSPLPLSLSQLPIMLCVLPQQLVVLPRETSTIIPRPLFLRPSFENAFVNASDLTSNGSSFLVSFTDYKTIPQPTPQCLPRSQLFYVEDITNEKLISPNGFYQVFFQAKVNESGQTQYALVLFKTQTQEVIWSAPANSAAVLTIRPNGDLWISYFPMQYEEAGRLIWTSMSGNYSNPSPPYRLVVTDYGHLTLLDSNGKIVQDYSYATGMSPHAALPPTSFSGPLEQSYPYIPDYIFDATLKWYIGTYQTVTGDYGTNITNYLYRYIRADSGEFSSAVLYGRGICNNQPFNNNPRPYLEFKQNSGLYITSTSTCSTKIWDSGNIKPQEWPLTLTILADGSPVIFGKDAFVEELNFSERLPPITTSQQNLSVSSSSINSLTETKIISSVFPSTAIMVTPTTATQEKFLPSFSSSSLSSFTSSTSSFPTTSSSALSFSSFSFSSIAPVASTSLVRELVTFPVQNTEKEKENKEENNLLSQETLDQGFSFLPPSFRKKRLKKKRSWFSWWWS